MVFVLSWISFHRTNTIRNLSFYLSIYLSIYPSTHIYLSILSIYLSLSIYLFLGLTKNVRSTTLRWLPTNNPATTIITRIPPESGILLSPEYRNPEYYWHPVSCRNTGFRITTGNRIDYCRNLETTRRQYQHNKCLRRKF